MTDDNSTPSVQGEQIKGKKVTNHNGTEAGADGNQVKYRFSGSPTSLYELQPEAGEVRVMTVTAQCTNGTHGKLGADGTFLEASWAIREVVIGRQTTLKEPVEQTATDDDEIAEESAAAENQLSLVESETAEAEQKAVSGVADPFNPDGKK
ncbi:hypothetical protein SEA_TWONLO_46 [Gordonia phage Twonlo]|uniref:Uncharacterized protein n=2 Tax=Dexdertvirus TaxID=2948679 RepID=A0A411CSF4_9CAUD|nr:hypothetical protein J1598_gp49 [Gordonia phage Tiamoceli]QDF19631.1 hypothetical protein SEA_ROADKILL_46 [Gordonia Terrae phage RoadKill]QOI66792.1 hypothetical protein SEA_TWONLO_46 [Gordonia phage Twonlo]QWY80243.1 hypothetical protein SEA_EDMUNDFERRY_47 [Gordonia phage EdmundFerry]WNO27350.1 hypothetical protein SEA_KWEKEL_48 [Gordonia phage Kwekel]QAY16793.1 hypothetical protein SEA_TIAMOCELI_49 [Gordonia phage Tiamoceli]